MEDKNPKRTHPEKLVFYLVKKLGFIGGWLIGLLCGLMVKFTPHSTSSSFIVHKVGSFCFT